mmetsp:Transcript_18707/g.28416  ORF Transcript_18707/g.28416 Transcript_18707/m.28416 type:complete len:480 (+) Transcript_18707:49-1488(+)
MKGRINVPLACFFLAAAALLLVDISRETKTPRRQLMQLDPRTVELKSGVMTGATPVGTANTAVVAPNNIKENPFVQEKIRFSRMADDANDFDCVPLDASAELPEEGVIRAGQGPHQYYHGPWSFNFKMGKMVNMISDAKAKNCVFELHPQLLPGWEPKASRRGQFLSDSDVTCKASPGDSIKRGKPVYSSCAISMLSNYFGIDELNAFGRSCPVGKPYSVLHVTGGENGDYNTTSGRYEPSGGEHLAPKPTAYYTVALRDIIDKSYANGEGAPEIYVICQSMASLACEFFQKTAHLFQHEAKITFSAGNPLIDDLHIMLCAREVALSTDIMNILDALLLSKKLRKVYDFSWQPLSPVDCDLKPQHVVKYWIDNAEDNLEERIKPWNNTSFQRHEMNKHYKMMSCEDPAYMSNVPPSQFMKQLRLDDDPSTLKYSEFDDNTGMPINLNSKKLIVATKEFEVQSEKYERYRAYEMHRANQQ